MIGKALAIVGNLGDRAGYSLVEQAMRLDGSLIGDCIVIDATISVIDLVSILEEYGVNELILLVPGGMGGEGLKCERITPVEEPGKVEPDRLVADLWQNLTGSLLPEDYVKALRVFWRRPFTLCRCSPGEDGDCSGLLGVLLDSACKDSISDRGDPSLHI